jgi:probable phosphoglycerate mutase
VELLLIRHALPVRRELTAGAADPELSEAGVAQAERLAEYLATERLDAVYTSPLRRAVETGAPVARVQGVDTIVVDGVAEWDRDSPEYVPVEELKAADDPRWRAMLDGEWGGAESPEEFTGRVLDAVESLVAAHRGGRIAVVCHGGVINTYLSHVLGLGAATNGFFYPNYTSIHRIAAASSGERSVVTINETSHLRGSGLPMGLFQRG